jgi:ABC-type dipeptide/oligopeptide/nickel transport system permease component
LLWFVTKRLIWMVLTLWAVFTISFLLMRAVPGGPLGSERNVPPEVRKNIEARYRLDEPLHRQYLRELGNVARLDLGHPFLLGDFHVNEVIAAGFPVSASLGVLALSFALTLGLLAGIVSAMRRGGLLDLTLMSMATVGIALPNFVVAGLAIILLVFLWPIFPAAGWGTPSQVILPAFCLGLPYAAEIARLVRTGMLDVLSQDFIRTAYAKGLPTRAVIFRHAIKAAMLPVVSFLGPAIAGILTGSVVVEQVFAIPGLGYHFVQAATQRDYTLAMGLVLLYTALLYLMNLAVDVSYSLLDPRVKVE